jgi:hypothetical protein
VAGLAEGLGLALLDCFFDFPVEVLVDFVVRLRGARVVAVWDVDVVVSVKLDSLA